MSEWLKEAVLKTVVPQGTGGSNPPCSEVGIDLPKDSLYVKKLLVANNMGDSNRSAPV